MPNSNPGATGWKGRQESWLPRPGRWPGRPPTEDDQVWPDAVTEPRAYDAALYARLVEATPWAAGLPLKTAMENNPELLPSAADPPRWFPVKLVADLIRQEFPAVTAADEFASERNSDEVQRLASQILWIAEGNSNEW